MDMLYKYLGLTKNSNKSTNRQRASAPKPGEKWSIQMQNHMQNNEFIDGLMGF
jgi:hypothetical protein